MEEEAEHCSHGVSDELGGGSQIWTFEKWDLPSGNLAIENGDLELVYRLTH